MSDWNVIGLLCEDVRTEMQSTFTLIGVFPDNIQVPNFPGMFSRLGVYMRIHVSQGAEPKGIKARIKLIGGEEHALGGIEKDFVAGQLAEVAKKGMPHAGFIITSIATLPIPRAGRIDLIASYGDEEIICGTLNVAENPTSSSASERPVSQPQSVPPET